jgi:tetratricopeptide (TPR) repeat protein
MPHHPRIDDLRRRVQSDPASIAFAQLAEEYRRAGEHQAAVDVCRAGLLIHPSYLSARVTLGRALLELGELDAALGEFQAVLAGAPENLSALRGLAEIHHRRGALADALTHYHKASSLARNDPDLEQTVADLQRRIEAAASQPLVTDPADVTPDAMAGADFHPLPDEIPADSDRDRAVRTIAALEQWLAVVHATGADRRA